MELPGLLDTVEKNLLPKDGVVEYIYPFIREDYFDDLASSIDWQQDEIKMFGKVTPLPRLTAWYGDSGTTYIYSGIINKPLPWNEELLKLKASVESHCRETFNSVLLNYYRNGTEHMGWHSDNEKELGEEPIIASLSFGEKRRFQFKHKSDKGQELITIEPESGSLIVMKGSTQEHWNHRISKTSAGVGPRINLTFRRITL